MCGMHRTRFNRNGTTDLSPKKIRQKCPIDDFLELEDKRGMCEKHYRRYMKFGDAEAEVKVYGTTAQIQQFINEALFADTDDCIIWPFGKDSDGYGWFKIPTEEKPVAVHRYMTEKFHGKSKGDANHSCHSCDTPSCINGKHLRWDTHQENMYDKSRKTNARI
jgi:hypothetical protein